MGCLNDRSRIATFLEKLAHFFRFVRKIRVITAQTSESKKLRIGNGIPMPSLKKLTKELRQEILSYLFPFPPCTTNLAFRLATLIFAKTRFCSHINFIGRCLQSKVIPKGFRSNFHASSFSRSNQYLYQIQWAQNSFSRNIMRITIRAMCLERDDLDKQIFAVPLRTFQNLSGCLGKFYSR